MQCEAIYGLTLPTKFVRNIVNLWIMLPLAIHKELKLVFSRQQVWSSVSLIRSC